MKLKCRWLRIFDTRGDAYEYEDCAIVDGAVMFTVYYKAPIGIVKKVFMKRNLICYEYLPDKEKV